MSGKYTGIIINEKMKHNIKSLNISVYIPVFLTTIKFPGTSKEELDKCLPGVAKAELNY